MHQGFCYSGLPFEEVKEIWHKEQIITSLLRLRDGINYCDESGDIWEDWALEDLLGRAAEAVEISQKLGIQSETRLRR